MPASNAGGYGSRRSPGRRCCNEREPAKPSPLIRLPPTTLSPRSAERARSRPAPSERAAQAGLGGDGGAAVVHPDAFERAEQADMRVGREVEAGAGEAAEGIDFAGRHEGEVLAQQDGVDRGVANPLDTNGADMHAGFQRAGAAERRNPGEIDLEPLLEILEGAAADGKILRRAGLTKTVEEAGDIAHARG